MSKVHDLWLPVSLRCTKGSLPFVSFANANIVVSGSDIKLGEQRVSLEFFGDVFDIRYWVLISDRPVVDRPIVLYRAVGPVFRLDTEGACGIGGSRRFDISFRQLFFRPFVHELGFRGAERIDFTLEGVGSVGFEVDGMVVVPS